ncbi:hypothetical protein [Agromyces marinus]|uniref:hypothetical protein n=1 Tax=Agromyces marinus TaxID=1389020 RepID=UPI002573043A|nr:hypothetical protein [Agromyces marinus]
MFELPGRDDRPVLVEDDRAGAGGSLVDRQDVVGHGRSVLSVALVERVRPLASAR